MYTFRITIIYNEQCGEDEKRIISFRFWIEKLLNRWFEVAYWLYLSLHRTGLNSANPDWLSVQSLRTTVTEDERTMQYDPWQCHASESSLSENRRANCTLCPFVHQRNTFRLFISFYELLHKYVDLKLVPSYK